MKKVILILIDSLMPKDMENAIKTGRTPALKFLMEKGLYQKKCVTSFPTMTASVDATLMTGVYPDKHKLPGLIWYNDQENRLVDYVNGAKTVLKLGFKKSARDVLINLNDFHLSKKVKTLYEELTEHNKTSGSINFILHRGKNTYHLKPPFLFNFFTGSKYKNKKITGPDILSVGAFCKPDLKGRRIPWGFNQSIFNYYGINDKYAIEVAKNLIESGSQPDFMIIYMPDHDHYLHKHIDEPLLSLERVDTKIRKLLDLYESWDKAIEYNTFIIIGDHGQTPIGKEEFHNIDLDTILNDFVVANIEQISEKDEVIIANNERMAYIYPLKGNLHQNIINTLLKEERIDFVAWKEKERVYVKNYQGEIMSFANNGDYYDVYNKEWDVDGKTSILDLTIKQKEISFGKYPDALSRLYGALYSQEINSIVISAKPFFEFISDTFPTHLGGGSHGSLHEIDSIVPLIISGASIQPEKELRIVDLKDYILQLLNVNSTTTG